MSRPRYGWKGYAKDMIRAYQVGQANENEFEAVKSAIYETEKMPEGRSRIKVVELVLMKKTHTLAGAASTIPCGKRTAERWQSDFISKVGKNFRCDSLI